MLKNFKKFLLRGSVVDLAVAVVVGAAFVAVVNSIVKDLFTPLISAIFGKTNFSKLNFVLNGSTFNYGDFLNALVTFISISAVVFFFVIQPINRLQKYNNKDSDEKDCNDCLSTIPKKAIRCKFCSTIQQK